MTDLRQPAAGLRGARPDSTLVDAQSAVPNFLSEAQCRDLVARLARYADGVGYTAAVIWSAQSRHVRWARNRISTSGEVQNTYIQVCRDLQGAMYRGVFLNEMTDVALVAAARRAERLSKLTPQQEQWEMVQYYAAEAMDTPSLFSEPTAALGAATCADAAIAMAKRAADAGVLSAGYIDVSVHSMAVIDTAGHVRYCPYTTASYSVTARDPKGQGSGWAGVDWLDWNKVDVLPLTQRALDKCLQSRHPVAVEPGRYTTILEPQAVCDLVGQLFQNGWLRDILHRECAEDLCADGSADPFYKTGLRNGGVIRYGQSKLGERIIDERITISVDPMDPELGFPPFRPNQVDPFGVDVFHPITWFKDGVLTALEYNKDPLGVDGDRDIKTMRGVNNSGAFRMSVTGQMTSVEEMITTTKRGLVVTRFDRIQLVDSNSMLLRGYTRDGLWLIEDGKISKAIKNFMFVESILFALNNIEQLGVPQRVFHPASGWLAFPQPVIVPPMKIRDFSFTALVDSV
ncbi:MAG TPA: metallopeptidase TldD-related protein [Gemmatimonadaceae bacterium]|jgi:predicted Zn-dependent protease|nr:metallopeptidase TldD-related protein [Gemmatimonadaceae bacterium]